ncbi:MAG: hypothetical protein DK306_002524 [Chloroflexi bacterium]|nr:MAG: hypothetical protein DK306_002524 [Chloroflexota bacterium]
MALSFVTQPLDRWVAQGRIDQAEATATRARLSQAETRLGMRHLGAALALSVPLRFPFGSLTRFALVLAFRRRANAQYAAAEIDAATYRTARETHTRLVAVVALIPGFGAGAYLLSPALRRSGNLLPLLIDETLYHAPFGLYRRLRLHKLVPTRIPALPHLRAPTLFPPRLRILDPDTTSARAASPFPPATTLPVIRPAFAIAQTEAQAA